MKKIIYIFILFSALLHASNDYELKLYEKLFTSLFSEKVKVFVEGGVDIKFDANSKFIIVVKCEDADIIISNIMDKNCDKPVFCTSYSSLFDVPNSIGAFYWSKGRPNIVFVKNRVDRFGIKLPQSFRKYEMDEL